ncbi:MAG TPA: helix-turn-helix transcriptional regulator [Candidatus Limnocylindria bacterium]|nr:helix-turn-helix transcriptional regulator [Candidatus Limnocylindria bacterium]
MDVPRLPAVLRAIRIRKGWRQIDVARAAGVSRSMVGRAESPRIAKLPLEAILRIATALDVRIDITARWKGGELDRMLNAGHAGMHEQVAGLLAGQPPWLFRPEVSFAIYGERGVIDILAFHPPTGALLVIELKTELVDVQNVIGTMDRYTRLAARIAADLGWKANQVSCWILFPDTSTNRRRVAAHSGVLRAAFPADGRTMRGWLDTPEGTIRALSFLPPAKTVAAAGTGVRRVRRRVRSAA